MDDLKETEWDLLDALWTLERATARDVAEHLLERRGWAYSTVKTLLDRMVERELVSARKVGNVWEYSAAIERAQARKGAWARFVELAFGGKTAPALHFAAGASKLTAEQRAALLALLEEGEP
jgi:BlaI family transcriptional regulator, penicillinase repressor